MRVLIGISAWKKIKRQATLSFPNECVGFYIGFVDYDLQRIYISKVYPCKNISEDRTVGSMVSPREINKVIRECKKANKIISSFFVGQYHSHPTTGGVAQSELDKKTGKKWKEYGHQLILGIKSKSEMSIRKRFYFYDKKSGSWKEEKIIVLKS
jgi:proteasome lid subunit RPN8/RPN11